MVTHEIVIECNNYAGTPSEERCRVTEEYVKEGIQDLCQLKSVTMKESLIQDSLIQPTIILRYTEGDSQTLIEQLDEILLEVGITAIKAVVSRLASRAVEGAIAGGGVGLVAGRSGSSAVAVTLLGAILGGLIGNSVEKRVLEFVASKDSGKWLTRSIKVKEKS